MIYFLAQSEDNFLWTQLCTYQFAAIGIAAQPSRVTDLVFKEEFE